MMFHIMKSSAMVAVSLVYAYDTESTLSKFKMQKLINIKAVETIEPNLRTKKVLQDAFSKSRRAKTFLLDSSRRWDYEWFGQFMNTLLNKALDQEDIDMNIFQFVTNGRDKHDVHKYKPSFVREVQGIVALGPQAKAILESRALSFWEAVVAKRGPLDLNDFEIKSILKKALQKALEPEREQKK